MAQVSFEIKYYFDANGLDWADIPNEELDKILENCRSGIRLNLNAPYHPTDVEINGLDNYSNIPKEVRDLGCDSFAEIQLAFDIDDEILAEFGVDILDESESYESDIDSLFGSGALGVSEGLIIGVPEQVWIDET